MPRYKDNRECIKNFEALSFKDRQRLKDTEAKIRELKKSVASIELEMLKRIQCVLAFLAITEQPDVSGNRVYYDITEDNISSYSEMEDGNFWVQTEYTGDYNHSEEYIVPAALVFANDLRTLFESWESGEMAKKVAETTAAVEKQKAERLALYNSLKKEFETSKW